MGNYNPHAPYIIGQEWVPIRQANFAPDKVTEQGYTFHINHSVTPITGAYYVAEVPQTQVNKVSDLISVYPAGHEDLTGPIKQVFIPVSTVWTTGGAISGATVAALLNPSDGQAVRFTGPTDNNTYLGMSFDVPSYAQQLMGKRILDVSFRYSISAHDLVNISQITTQVGFARNMFGQALIMKTSSLEGTVSSEPTVVKSFSLSSLNFWWDATRDIYTVHDIYPWRYQELARFAATEAAASRMLLMFFNGIQDDQNAFIQFVDMQVTYCEETRVLYGGRSTTSLQDPLGTITQSNYEPGPNLVRLFNTSFASNSTALTPGDYVVTLTHDDMPIDGIIGSPTVKAIRELYPVTPQSGIRVNKSLTPDDTFTSEITPVLTEITLHTTAAVVTGVHPYGTQDDIPVYGAITAIQEIEDDPVTTSRTFPQVRFYARRFGTTTVPLTFVDVATGLSTVSITVEEFDALTEIVDGWREVNLRFATPPSFATAAGDVDWRWQATGELARNQWQVLGAGSQTFAAHSIGPASYFAPVGDTVTLTWQSPTISGAANDTLSDAVLIFSQDPPAVSGFAVATFSQAVTGITQHCDVDSRCVPTAIQGNRLSWTPFGVCDDFARLEVDGWGDAPTGQTWTNTGGAAGDYDVNGDAGTHLLTNTNISRNSIIAALSADQHVEAYGVGISQVATGNAIEAGVIMRHQDTSNRYFIEIHVNTDNTVTLHIHSQVAGTITDLAALTLPNTTHYANAQYNIVGEIIGTTLRGRAWQVGGIEPLTWQLTVVDANLSATGSYGVRSRRTTGNTNTDPIVSYDVIRAFGAELAGSRLEIQRQDDVSDDWQTIMESTTVCPVSFDDYEARVGIESRYQIRVLNMLDFAGTWVTGSGTVPTPGVTITGDGNSVLIFTSNENPDANLAYVMQWEGQPVETFVFPEASEVQLQHMFGKDFFTAFHPLERGGDQFTRVVIVNVAAIPAPSLANFRGLRDLAWAELNYVCVRDELGNRWFANIIVPDGNVRLNRTIYMAQIQVSEVTGTPTPIAEVVA